MFDAVLRANVEAQLALICAHPELAGKEAVAGVLTQESKTEQASAGLDRCTPEELARLRAVNKTYREKFGFPFVMAVKHRSKQEILAALALRVANAREQEFVTCLTEIGKIGKLRLDAMLLNTPAVHISAQRIWDRCEALALCSETSDVLTRVYLSEQQRAANALVQASENKSHLGD